MAEIYCGKLRRLMVSYFVLMILWYVNFNVLKQDFWLSMGVSILIAVLLTWKNASDDNLKFNLSAADVIIGILSALSLYGVFYIGKEMIVFLFPDSTEMMHDIYSTKTQMNPAIIAILLIFVIGPGEELIWRRFFQRELAGFFSEKSAFYMTLILYVSLHIMTFNLVLILSSLICGVFWGYIYYKTKNLKITIISHSLWDVLVFIVFPLS